MASSMSVSAWLRLPVQGGIPSSKHRVLVASMIVSKRSDKEAAQTGAEQWLRGGLLSVPDDPEQLKRLYPPPTDALFRFRVDVHMDAALKRGQQAGSWLGHPGMAWIGLVNWVRR